MDEKALKKELSTLSKEQRAVVESKSRFLRVIAGAGAGKTTTMAMRIVNLLAHGMLPKEIVAFTFTERAAQNIKNRIYEKVGKIDPLLCNYLGEMFIGTIHSFCFQMLQDHYGYGNFDVMDENQEMAFILRMGWGFNLGPQNYPQNCSTFLSSLSVVYDEQLSLSNIDAEVSKMKSPDSHTVKFTKHLKRYEELLDEHKLLTFARIISLIIKHLNGNPAPLSYIKHLIVDEFQDVNRAQQQLVALLARNTSVYIVGDPRQCIYQWRGSDNTSFDNFSSFTKKIDGKEPETVYVSDNWRSCSAIVENANKFASTLKNRYEPMRVALPEKGTVIKVDFETNEDEADKITDYIKNLVDKEKKCQYKDIALLFRSVSTSAEPFLRYMKNKKIPFLVGGNIGLFKRDEAQLVGSLFAWLYDSAFWKEGRYQNTNAHKGDDILNYAESKWTQVFGKGEFPNKLLTKWKSEVKSGSYKGLTEVYHDLLFILGFLNLDQNDKLDAAIMANLGRFNGLLTDYQTSILTGGRSFNWDRDIKGLFWFIQNHAYEAYGEQPADDIRGVDSVQVMTVHQAKGLEWLLVFMPGLTSKRFPSSQMGKIRSWFVPRTLFAADRYDGGDDDERRLFYVAITRARDALILSTFRKISLSQGVSPYLEDLDIPNQPGESPLPMFPLKRIHKEDEIATYTGGEIIEYDRCGYFYRLRNLWNYQSTFSPYLGYGKSLHHALRRAAEMVKSDGKDPEDTIDIVFNQEGFHMPFAPKTQRDIIAKNAKELLLRYVKKFKDDVLNIKEVEARLEFPLHKATISGRVDVLIGDKDKIIEVRDYKTSDTVTTIDEAGFQVQLYTIGINLTKEKVQKGSIAYFKDEHGEPSIERVNVTEKYLDKAKEKAENTISNIKSGNWNAQVGSHCKNCDYRNICRYTNAQKKHIVK